MNIKGVSHVSVQVYSLQGDGTLVLKHVGDKPLKYIPSFLPSFLPSLLTYLHIPWSRVLLEKLTGLQLVKKCSAFYGTRKFVTAFTSARHLSLS